MGAGFGVGLMPTKNYPALRPDDLTSSSRLDIPKQFSASTNIGVKLHTICLSKGF